MTTWSHGRRTVRWWHRLRAGMAAQPSTPDIDTDGKQDEQRRKDRDDHDEQPYDQRDHALADADQRRERVVEDRAELPAPGRSLRLRHDRLEIDLERRLRRAVRKKVALGGHALDVALDARELVLDLEHVVDRRRLGHDSLERGLTRLRVRYPSVEIDDLAGDVLRLHRLVEHLDPDPAQAGERLVPVLSGNPVRDRCIVLIVLA